MIKFNRIFILSMFTILIFTSCQNSKFDDQLIIGSWKVSEWKLEETGKTIPNKMDMHFDSEKMYSIDYGSKKEEGKYWIAGEFLHTVETGQTEKKVKIISLTSDTMRFQMNRGGHLESVIMTKKQKQ